MKEVVLEAGGLLRGSSGPALQTYLQRQPGILHAEANYFSDSVTVGSAPALPRPLAAHGQSAEAITPAWSSADNSPSVSPSERSTSRVWAPSSGAGELTSPGVPLNCT